MISWTRTPLAGTRTARDADAAIKNAERNEHRLAALADKAQTRLRARRMNTTKWLALASEEG